MARRNYRRRNYRRGRSYNRQEPINPFAVIVFIFLFLAILPIFNWIANNIVLVIALTVIVIGIGVFLYFLYNRNRNKKITESIPKNINILKEQLDAFTINIPKFSKHNETSYQIDFGRYLTEKMQDCKIEYESINENTRPDIIINNNIAIEIKALKDPSTKSGREYNKMHMESIFRKTYTYKKNWNQVVVIIFNSDYVRDLNWTDYEDAKNNAKEQGIYWLEK